MFHGGDGPEAGANNCKPLTQNLRPNQHVFAVLLLVCCSSGQMVPCRRRGCNKIAFMHKKTV